ncbi:MAG: glycosyltransferase [Ignavibacteriaceae bacterium]|nr:glycosyltransferase [Ignavibacteriaceae bacterium]
MNTEIETNGLKNSKNPLVSIQMITYNHVSYIGQAIESVLMQKTNFPIELVIGEDCSTDGTREIVFDYAKKYPEIIRIITSEKNVGIHENGIRTLLSCTGKYIALLEGDDYWTDPYKLQKQVDFLEANPDYGMVYTDYDILYERKNPVTLKARNKYYWGKKEPPSGNIFEELLKGNFIRTLTVCFRKKYFENALNQGLFKNDWLQQDLIIWLEIGYYSKVKYLNKSMATYRNHQSGISRTGGSNKIINFGLNNIQIRLFFSEKYECSEQTRMILKKKYYHYLVQNILLYNGSAEAREFLKLLSETNYSDQTGRIKLLLAKNKITAKIAAIIIKSKNHLLSLKNFRIPKWILFRIYDTKAAFVNFFPEKHK